ncbi:MAG: ATP-dependent DNA helicase [Haloarculaceae archaeon]
MTADGDESDENPAWRDVFGHEEPYDDQAEGVETAVETARESGFTILEGACGTGKTMLALTAGLYLVRDPDSAFERVFVLTSVKQQLRQFEEDLRTINANLPGGWDPISGLTLVGKADVCPYNREGAGGIDDGNVYHRCESLRERTRGLTEDTTAGALAQQARSQQIGLADSGADDGGAATYLESAGGKSPYPREMPEHGAGTSEVEFCPFYAQYLEDLPEDGSPVEAVPFDHTELGLVEPDDLVRLSVEAGTCPHSVMGALLPRVEVVVGNYYHAFDPTTVESFTGALLDEGTFVVCDEAHMLEPRVRDLVGGGVSDTALRDAVGEIAQVVQPLAFTEETGRQTGPVDEIRAELEDASVGVEALQRTREFLVDLREYLDDRVVEYLDAEHPGWRESMPDLPDAEIPLRDPEEPAVDDLTEWAERAGWADDDWVRAEAVGATVAGVLDRVEDAGDEDDEGEARRSAPGVGRTLAAWNRAGHAEFFREIELERTWNDVAPRDSWRRAYNARFALHNCVPGDVIGERLGAFGGGVLMSATLEPMDVFRAVTGLDALADEGRPVVERVYGLEFPEENRASFAVKAPKFTYGNRGAPGEENRVREAHARAMRQVAAGPGNVLVGMPSYAEAEWAAGVLRAATDVDKPVLLDESSVDEVTEDLKTAFFDGPPKVLVTSLRGTLTEGVDYRGDRLYAAVVCGVPIVNTASPRTRAVRTAYDRRFGESRPDGSPGASSSEGFRTALSTPAVRKARQAVGRVIRGPEEVGVRVLLDERYASDSWDSVRDLLGPDREEFRPVGPEMLSFALERFRESRRQRSRK